MTLGGRPRTSGDLPRSALLPAHVVALGAVAGLALAALARLEVPGRALLAAAAVLVALTWLAGVPRERRVLLAAVGLAGLGWWWGSARLDALDRSPLRAHVGEASRFLIEVTGEPRVGAFDQRLPAVVRRFGGVRLRERVQLVLPLGRAPPQGARIRALAVVRLPATSPRGFDERTWLGRQGVHVVLRVDEWSRVGRRGGFSGVGDRLRSWLRRACTPGLTGERRAVVVGIVLGDDAGLTPGLKTAFRRSGLYHLLAVSGQNVVLLATGVLGLVWLLGFPRACGHVCTLAAIATYVLAVGPQASVVRAAVAGSAVSFAWLLGRERDGWHVLLLAAIVLLAWSPYALFDPGFQLSFAAVAAIFVLVPQLQEWLEGYPVPRSLGLPASVSAACGLATAPILLFQFGAVPLLGVVANALVEPAIGPLLGLALVAAATEPVAPSLAAAIAWVDGWIAAYVVLCARVVAALPFAQARGAGAAAVTACSLVAGAYAWRRWRTSSSRPT
jgi:competence protein ComEC